MSEVPTPLHNIDINQAAEDQLERELEWTPHPVTLGILWCITKLLDLKDAIFRLFGSGDRT